MNPTVSSVTDEDLAEAKTFLEKHRETSMFLLSVLDAYGPKLTQEVNSGNFKCIRSQGRLQAVFSLLHRGNLLAQTDGGDFTEQIVSACQDEQIEVEGVLGEWETAERLWNGLLNQDGSLQTSYQSKEFLYRLPLPAKISDIPKDVRNLEPADFEAWERLDNIYVSEEGLPIQETREQRRKGFERGAAKGNRWGLWDEEVLVSMASYNAKYGSLAQVGGVVTEPSHRRRGFSREVMKKLIVDSVERHGVDLLILFTGEKNVAARNLYEGLGFEQVGFYGIFFGKRDATTRP